MKSFRLTFSFTLFFLTSFIAFGEARCPGDVAQVQYHPLLHSHMGISAILNGSGPYEFMVDTGAQITVLDPDLAVELKLQTVGSLQVATVASNVEVRLVTAALFAVPPVAIEQLQMAVEDLGPIQAEYPRLRGILGNNFLGRFDLLIDHSHKTLCFDDSRRLQENRRGDRIPILSTEDRNPRSASAQPVLVSVHLPMTGPAAPCSGSTPAPTFRFSM